MTGDWCSLTRVLGALPQVLALSRERQLRRVVDVLAEVGLAAADIVAIVEAFPAVLGLGVDAQLLKVVDYIEVTRDC